MQASGSLETDFTANMVEVLITEKAGSAVQEVIKMQLDDEEEDEVGWSDMINWI